MLFHSMLSFKSFKLSLLFKIPFFFLFCCSVWISSTACLPVHWSVFLFHLVCYCIFFSSVIVFFIVFYFILCSTFHLFVEVLAVFTHSARVSKQLYDHYFKWFIRYILLISIPLSCFWWVFYLVLSLGIYSYFFILLYSLYLFLCIRRNSYFFQSWRSGLVKEMKFIIQPSPSSWLLLKPLDCPWSLI